MWLLLGYPSNILVKDVELILEWVVSCLISVFMNNKRAIYKFRIFEFFIFKISDIG